MSDAIPFVLSIDAAPEYMPEPELGLAAVGGKGYNLIKLARAGFPVPNGYILTTRAYREFVVANNLEMLNLLEFFRKNFSEEQLMEVARHAAQKNQKVSGMSEAEVLLYKSPCPLLKGGACIAYHARPMACRIYLSRSLSSCFEFFKNPGNPDNFPALIDFPLRVGKLLNEGFARAMRDQGVEVSEFRIEEGLDLFLNQRFDLRVISPNPSDQ